MVAEERRDIAKQPHPKRCLDRPAGGKRRNKGRLVGAFAAENGFGGFEEDPQIGREAHLPDVLSTELDPLAFVKSGSLARELDEQEEDRHRDERHGEKEEGDDDVERTLGEGVSDGDCFDLWQLVDLQDVSVNQSEVDRLSCGYFGL